MFDFANLNRVVFQTVDNLNSFAKDVEAKRSPDFKTITHQLSLTNQVLEETIDQSMVSDAAMKAIAGLRKDLRADVIRNISRQLLTNIPLLQIQVGAAQSQQHLFSKELKKFEERLQYVLQGLKKSRGEKASGVEQDQDTK